jgi:hypothetical protein
LFFALDIMGGENDNTAVNPRVPVSLQQIFTASQRGDDVSKIEAPSKGMGFKVFRRAWGRKQKKSKAIKAPTTSSLNSERSGTTRETAADASRKAMKDKAKPVSNKHIWEERESIIDSFWSDKPFSFRLAGCGSAVSPSLP